MVGDAGSIDCEACRAIAGVLTWLLGAGMGTAIVAGTVGDTISSLSPSPNFSSCVLTWVDSKLVLIEEAMLG